MGSAHRDQKRASGAMELELQQVMNSLKVPGIKAKFSEREDAALNSRDITSAPATCSIET